MGNWLQDAGGWLGEQASRVGYQASRLGNAVTHAPVSYDTPWTGKGELGTSFGPNANAWGITNEDREKRDVWGVLKPEYQTGNAQAPYAGGKAPSAPMVMAPSAFATPPAPQANTAQGASAAVTQGNTHGMAGLYGPGYVSTNQSPDQKAALGIDAFQQQNRAIANQVGAMKNPWDTGSIEFQKALAGEVNRANMNNAGMVERVNGSMAGRGAAAKAAAEANAAAYQRQAVSGAESGMYKAALDGSSAFEFQKANALSSLNNNELGAAQAYGSLWQQQQGKAQYERSQANLEKQQGIDNAWRESMQEYAKTTNMDAKESDFWHNAVGSIPGIAAFMKESGLGPKEIIAMIKGGQVPGGGQSSAGLGPLNGATGAYGGGINYSYPQTEVPPLNFGLHF